MTTAQPPSAPAEPRRRRGRPRQNQNPDPAETRPIPANAAASEAPDPDLTDAIAAAESDSKDEATATPTWEDIAVDLCRRLAHPQFPAADLAKLRRMNPEQSEEAVFWHTLSQYALPISAIAEAKWGAVAHGIAWMTPNQHRGQPQEPEGFWPSAHNPNIPAGQALYQGGDPGRRGPAFFHESRLNRLLNASGPSLRYQFSLLCRTLGQTTQAANWRQLAGLIFSDDYNPQYAELVRRRIARNYYRSLNRGSGS